MRVRTDAAERIIPVLPFHPFRLSLIANLILQEGEGLGPPATVAWEEHRESQHSSFPLGHAKGNMCWLPIQTWFVALPTSWHSTWQPLRLAAPCCAAPRAGAAKRGFRQAKGKFFFFFFFWFVRLIDRPTGFPTGTAMIGDRACS
jgi:hypothetical protein